MSSSLGLGPSEGNAGVFGSQVLVSVCPWVRPTLSSIAVCVPIHQAGRSSSSLISNRSVGLDSEDGLGSYILAWCKENLLSKQEARESLAGFSWKSLMKPQAHVGKFFVSLVCVLSLSNKSVWHLINMPKVSYCAVCPRTIISRLILP